MTCKPGSQLALPGHTYYGLEGYLTNDSLLYFVAISFKECSRWENKQLTVQHALVSPVSDSEDVRGHLIPPESQDYDQM